MASTGSVSLGILVFILAILAPTPAAPQATAPCPDTCSGTVSVGALVGACIAVLIGTLLVELAIYLFYRHCYKKHYPSLTSSNSDISMETLNPPKHYPAGSWRYRGAPPRETPKKTEVYNITLSEPPKPAEQQDKVLFSPGLYRTSLSPKTAGKTRSHGVVLTAATDNYVPEFPTIYSYNNGWDNRVDHILNKRGNNDHDDASMVSIDLDDDEYPILKAPKDGVGSVNFSSAKFGIHNHGFQTPDSISLTDSENGDVSTYRYITGVSGKVTREVPAEAYFDEDEPQRKLNGRLVAHDNTVIDMEWDAFEDPATRISIDDNFLIGAPSVSTCDAMEYAEKDARSLDSSGNFILRKSTPPVRPDTSSDEDLYDYGDSSDAEQIKLSDKHGEWNGSFSRATFKAKMGQIALERDAPPDQAQMPDFGERFRYSTGLRRAKFLAMRAAAAPTARQHDQIHQHDESSSPQPVSPERVVGFIKLVRSDASKPVTSSPDTTRPDSMEIPSLEPMRNSEAPMIGQMRLVRPDVLDEANYHNQHFRLAPAPGSTEEDDLMALYPISSNDTICKRCRGALTDTVDSAAQAGHGMMKNAATFSSDDEFLVEMETTERQRKRRTKMPETIGIIRLLDTYDTGTMSSTMSKKHVRFQDQNTTTHGSSESLPLDPYTIVPTTDDELETQHLMIRETSRSSKRGSGERRIRRSKSAPARGRPQREELSQLPTIGVIRLLSTEDLTDNGGTLESDQGYTSTTSLVHHQDMAKMNDNDTDEVHTIGILKLISPPTSPRLKSKRSQETTASRKKHRSPERTVGLVKIITPKSKRKLKMKNASTEPHVPWTKLIHKLQEFVEEDVSKKSSKRHPKDVGKIKLKRPEGLVKDAGTQPEKTWFEIMQDIEDVVDEKYHTTPTPNKWPRTPTPEQSAEQRTNNVGVIKLSTPVSRKNMQDKGSQPDFSWRQMMSEFEDEMRETLRRQQHQPAQAIIKIKQDNVKNLNPDVAVTKSRSSQVQMSWGDLVRKIRNDAVDEYHQKVVGEQIDTTHTKSNPKVMSVVKLKGRKHRPKANSFTQSNQVHTEEQTTQPDRSWDAILKDMKRILENEYRRTINELESRLAIKPTDETGVERPSPNLAVFKLSTPKKPVAKSVTSSTQSEPTDETGVERPSHNLAVFKLSTPKKPVAKSVTSSTQSETPQMADQDTQPDRSWSRVVTDVREILENEYRRTITELENRMTEPEPEAKAAHNIAMFKIKGSKDKPKVKYDSGTQSVHVETEEHTTQADRSWDAILNDMKRILENEYRHTINELESKLSLEESNDNPDGERPSPNLAVFKLSPPKKPVAKSVTSSTQSETPQMADQDTQPDRSWSGVVSDVRGILESEYRRKITDLEESMTEPEYKTTPTVAVFKLKETKKDLMDKPDTSEIATQAATPWMDLITDIRESVANEYTQIIRDLQCQLAMPQEEPTTKSLGMFKILANKSPKTTIKPTKKPSLKQKSTSPMFPWSTVVKNAEDTIERRLKKEKKAAKKAEEPKPAKQLGIITLLGRKGYDTLGSDTQDDSRQEVEEEVITKQEVETQMTSFGSEHHMQNMGTGTLPNVLINQHSQVDTSSAIDYGAQVKPQCSDAANQVSQKKAVEIDSGIQVKPTCMDFGNQMRCSDTEFGIQVKPQSADVSSQSKSEEKDFGIQVKPGCSDFTHQAKSPDTEFGVQVKPEYVDFANQVKPEMRNADTSPARRSVLTLSHIEITSKAPIDMIGIPEPEPIQEVIIPQVAEPVQAPINLSVLFEDKFTQCIIPTMDTMSQYEYNQRTVNIQVQPEIRHQDTETRSTMKLHQDSQTSSYSGELIPMKYMINTGTNPERELPKEWKQTQASPVSDTRGTVTDAIAGLMASTQTKLDVLNRYTQYEQDVLDNWVQVSTIQRDSVAQTDGKVTVEIPEIIPEQVQDIKYAPRNSYLYDSDSGVDTNTQTEPIVIMHDSCYETDVELMDSISQTEPGRHFVSESEYSDDELIELVDVDVQAEEMSPLSFKPFAIDSEAQTRIDVKTIHAQTRTVTLEDRGVHVSAVTHLAQTQTKELNKDIMERHSQTKGIEQMTQSSSTYPTPQSCAYIQTDRKAYVDRSASPIDPQVTHRSSSPIQMKVTNRASSPIQEQMVHRANSPILVPSNETAVQVTWATSNVSSQHEVTVKLGETQTSPKMTRSQMTETERNMGIDSCIQTIDTPTLSYRDLGIQTMTPLEENVLIEDPIIPQFQSVTTESAPREIYVMDASIQVDRNDPHMEDQCTETTPSWKVDFGSQFQPLTIEQTTATDTVTQVASEIQVQMDDMKPPMKDISVQHEPIYQTMDTSLQIEPLRFNQSTSTRPAERQSIGVQCNAPMQKPRRVIHQESADMTDIGTSTHVLSSDNMTQTRVPQSEAGVQMTPNIKSMNVSVTAKPEMHDQGFNSKPETMEIKIQVTPLQKNAGSQGEIIQQVDMPSQYERLESEDTSVQVEPVVREQASSPIFIRKCITLATQTESIEDDEMMESFIAEEEEPICKAEVITLMSAPAIKASLGACESLTDDIGTQYESSVRDTSSQVQPIALHKGTEISVDSRPKSTQVKPSTLERGTYTQSPRSYDSTTQSQVATNARSTSPLFMYKIDIGIQHDYEDILVVAEQSVEPVMMAQVHASMTTPLSYGNVETIISRDEVKAEMRGELRKEVIHEIRDELRVEVKDVVRREIEQDVRDVVKREIVDDVLYDLTASIREDVREELTVEFESRIRFEMEDRHKKDIEFKVRRNLEPMIRSELEPLIRYKVEKELREQIPPKPICFDQGTSPKKDVVLSKPTQTSVDTISRGTHAEKPLANNAMTQIQPCTLDRGTTPRHIVCKAMSVQASMPMHDKTVQFQSEPAATEVQTLPGAPPSNQISIQTEVDQRNETTQVSVRQKASFTQYESLHCTDRTLQVQPMMINQHTSISPLPGRDWPTQTTSSRQTDSCMQHEFNTEVEHRQLQFSPITREESNSPLSFRHTRDHSTSPVHHPEADYTPPGLDTLISNRPVTLRLATKTSSNLFSTTLDQTPIVVEEEIKPIATDFTFQSIQSKEDPPETDIVEVNSSPEPRSLSPTTQNLFSKLDYSLRSASKEATSPDPSRSFTYTYTRYDDPPVDETQSFTARLSRSNIGAPYPTSASTPTSLVAYQSSSVFESTTRETANILPPQTQVIVLQTTSSGSKYTTAIITNSTPNTTTSMTYSRPKAFASLSPILSTISSLSEDNVDELEHVRRDLKLSQVIITDDPVKLVNMLLNRRDFPPRRRTTSPYHSRNNETNITLLFNDRSRTHRSLDYHHATPDVDIRSRSTFDSYNSQSVIKITDDPRRCVSEPRGADPHQWFNMFKHKTASFNVPHDSKGSPRPGVSLSPQRSISPVSPRITEEEMAKLPIPRGMITRLSDLLDEHGNLDFTTSSSLHSNLPDRFDWTVHDLAEIFDSYDAVDNFFSSEKSHTGSDYEQDTVDSDTDSEPWNAVLDLTTTSSDDAHFYWSDEAGRQSPLSEDSLSEDDAVSVCCTYDLLYSDSTHPFSVSFDKEQPFDRRKPMAQIDSKKLRNELELSEIIPPKPCNVKLTGFTFNEAERISTSRYSMYSLGYSGRSRSEPDIMSLIRDEESIPGSPTASHASGHTAERLRERLAASSEGGIADSEFVPASLDRIRYSSLVSRTRRTQVERRTRFGHFRTTKLSQSDSDLPSGQHYDRSLHGSGMMKSL